MRRGLLILAVFFAMAMSGQAAHAGMYGTQDKINHLQDIKTKGPNGEALYLGFLTSIHAFMLPYSTSDGGYVLGITGASDKFYRLSKEKIEQMQRAGALPSPLPVFKRSAIDYVAGYLLWPVLLIVGVACFVSTRKEKPHRYSEIPSA